MPVPIKTLNWKQLNFNDYGTTIETVQLWLQIVGKVRLRNTPWLNHGWHVPFYISARGLTTSSIPYPQGTFDIEFDFIDHQLLIRNSLGNVEKFDLSGNSVASFYQKVIESLNKLNNVSSG